MREISKSKCRVSITEDNWVTGWTIKGTGMLTLTQNNERLKDKRVILLMPLEIEMLFNTLKDNKKYWQGKGDN